jgi:TetR/AcrR family transcriptional regulator
MDKITEILNKAQELFGKYGYAKTTMTDIANNLEISKASLYYYYTDKKSIYLAVIYKEQEQFIKMLHDIIIQTENPVDILYQYVQIRIKYFSDMLNLNRARLDDYKWLKSAMVQPWKQFREKEKVEIRLILEKGIHNGLFKIEKPDETTTLFLDIFKGLIFNYLRHKDINFLNEADYTILEEQLSLFTSIFIKGIKN